MIIEKGVKIEKIINNSLAEKAGLLPGDIILSVNKHKLRDPLDFSFYSSVENLNLEIKRGRKIISIQIMRKDHSTLGIELKPFKVMRCKNNCIFCFVNQLPKGLRKTLYIKDEDYRLSFLYGNYITMSNLSKDDKKRIVEQRLSPLYISVHSTNRSLRNKLLGNSKAPDIIKELKFLSYNKIRFNIQIVLCPDYNDGKELKKTLSDLQKFYPYALSVAIVPVGLTKYKKHPIRPLEDKDAKQAIEIIRYFQKRFKKKFGNPFVFGSDELYLRAKLPLPPIKEYNELHQIENGVGMVPLFLQQAKKTKIIKISQSRKRFLTFTGLSFYPFLKKFIDRFTDNKGLKPVDVVPVKNEFFGNSITVAGLLTGRDVIKTLIDKIEGHEIILVPDVVLNEENRFLDDITLNDMEEALGIPVKKIKSTPDGIVHGMIKDL